MNEPVFILKGNVVYSKNKDELRILKDHYLISESGLVKGVLVESSRQNMHRYRYLIMGRCLIISRTDRSACACSAVYIPGEWEVDMELLVMAGDEYVSGRRQNNQDLEVCPAVHIVSLLTI
mgnify:CR=1 FL=1